MSINWQAVNQAALAILPTLLGRWLPNGRRVAAEYIALNPTRNDHRAGSFQINIRNGRWIDFATGGSMRDCDKGGDPISLYAYIYGTGQAEAARELAAQLGIQPDADVAFRGPAVASAAVSLADVDREKSKKIEYGRKIWDKTKGVTAGSPVEKYLRARGISVAIPASIRMAELVHPDDRSCLYPCMVAPMQVGRSITGVHRTYLSWDGGKAKLPVLFKKHVPRVKLMLGQAEGAAVRLGPLGPNLAIGEGIETSLSIASLAPDWTVWAGLSAGNLARIAIPDGVKRLVYVADGDAKYDPKTRGVRRIGLQAAQAAAEALMGIGVDTSILVAPDGLDFNDVLLRDRELSERTREWFAGLAAAEQARAA